MSVEKEMTKALLGGAQWCINGHADCIDIGDKDEITSYGLRPLDTPYWLKEKEDIIKISINFSAYVDRKTARRIYKAITNSDQRQGLLLAGV